MNKKISSLTTFSKWIEKYGGTIFTNKNILAFSDFLEMNRKRGGGLFYEIKENKFDEFSFKWMRTNPQPQQEYM